MYLTKYHFHNIKNYLYSKPVKGLQGCGIVYRFGFNGKENDYETQTQDYGFRIYDYRLGRFLSVDPLTQSYPWYTPYQFAGNKPIWAVDLDGLEEFYSTDGKLIGKIGKNTQVMVVKDKDVKTVSLYINWANKTKKYKHYATGKAKQFSVDVGINSLDLKSEKKLTEKLNSVNDEIEEKKQKIEKINNDIDKLEQDFQDYKQSIDDATDGEAVNDGVTLGVIIERALVNKKVEENKKKKEKLSDEIDVLVDKSKLLTKKKESISNKQQTKKSKK